MPAACQPATTSAGARRGYNQARSFAHLHDVDQSDPAGRNDPVRHSVRDQPRPNIGVQTDHPAPASRRQQPFKRGGHRLEHESIEPRWRAALLCSEALVRLATVRDRPRPAHGRSTSAGHHADERRPAWSDFIGVDKVAFLHPRISKLRSEHLSEGIAGQPGKERRRYAEATQADGNIEAGAAWMRLVREVATNRRLREEVDERIACDHNGWAAAASTVMLEVSRTASSKVSAASAVVGSVKNCSATSGAMVKQSTPASQCNHVGNAANAGQQHLRGTAGGDEHFMHGYHFGNSLATGVVHAS